MKKLKILKYLEAVAPLLQLPIYWEDTNGVILGGNEQIFKVSGALVREAFVGKTVHELYPKDMADHIKQHNEEVMRMRKVLSQEETIKNITTGKIKRFIAIKAPLYNDNNVIGIIGISIDITAEKKARNLAQKTKFLEDLERIASIIPTPIYWEDVNSVILGANKFVLKAVGLASLHDYVGKTLFELYPKEMAEHIKQHNEEVMRTEMVLSQEETIKDIATGKIKHFAAIKAPLRDDDGNIIGVVGASIDVTAEKEAERLKLENEVHSNLLQEQEKFMKIAHQVAHDIRSPLASLLMIVKSCTEIPEAERIALREAATGIGDIANHLLSQYQKKDGDAVLEADERQAILVSATLLQTLTDKKYQYNDLSVKFNHDFSQTGQFSFIKMEPSAFKRMISNLINNAVDAFDKKEGKVDLQLNADNEWVRVMIKDNGKGMSVKLVDKLMNNVSITMGKETGHGIGLTQVRDTLQRNQGELSIDSTPGQGTLITLTFPRIRAPHWIAEEIKIGANDIVIILDDDYSIHGAWATHFEPVLKKAPKIRLEHFQTANDALAFIAELSSIEKQKVFLLTDYELLRQELNGLDVVAKSQIQRSILVTSHYANSEVREQAAKTGTKILPKQLASEIPIKINEACENVVKENGLKMVDAVIVDDDESFVTNLLLFVFENDIVDSYNDPNNFLKNVEKYSKDTKIYLDNNFATPHLKGIDIAKKLHQQGYTRLYLLSGEVISENQIPNYLVVIRKDNLDTIKAL